MHQINRGALSSHDSSDVKIVIPPVKLGRQVCLFAVRSVDGRIPQYVRYHIGALKKCGLSVVLVAAADRMANTNLRRQGEPADGFFVHPGDVSNVGMWGDALRRLPLPAEAESVLLVDDTVFGPIKDLKPFLLNATINTADVVGMLESHAGRPHFLSSFVMLKGPALRNAAMQAFWAGNSGRGGTPLDEADLFAALVHAGVSHGAIYPFILRMGMEGAIWLDLLGRGVPYVPVNGVFDRLSEWERVVRDRALLAAIGEELEKRRPTETTKGKNKPPGKNGRTEYAESAAAVYAGLAQQALDPQDKDQYVGISDSAVSAASCDVKLVAYYLPQYHPIPENDEWWGRGFTDWSNVAKAVPAFVGHYQPRLPGELGYYDLRVPEVMRRQAQLARQYGLSAFCFHTYWFGGKRLLEQPLAAFLADPGIDIGFCLCWANENWTRRWDGAEQELLIGQSHSPEDDVAFIRYYKKYFDDPRYLRVDGKPILIVYRASMIPDAPATLARWRQTATELGFPGLYVVATNSFSFTDHRKFGFDAITEFPPHGSNSNTINGFLDIANPEFGGGVYSYQGKMEVRDMRPAGERLWPGVMPAWDNTARRRLTPVIFHGSTPKLFQRWLEEAIGRARSNPPAERFVMINAWNEWAEGAYLEPDRRYGYAYLDACAKALRNGAEVEREAGIDVASRPRPI